MCYHNTVTPQLLMAEGTDWGNGDTQDEAALEHIFDRNGLDALAVIERIGESIPDPMEDTPPVFTATEALWAICASGVLPPHIHLLALTPALRRARERSEACLGQCDRLRPLPGYFARQQWFNVIYDVTAIARLCGRESRAEHEQIAREYESVLRAWNDDLLALSAA